MIYYRGGKLRELADRIRVPDDVAVGYIISKYSLNSSNIIHRRGGGKHRLSSIMYVVPGKIVLISYC